MILICCICTDAVPHAICGILAREMSGKDIKNYVQRYTVLILLFWADDHSLQGAIKFGIEKVIL